MVRRVICYEEVLVCGLPEHHHTVNCLDVGVHGFSEVSGKACGGQCSVFSAHDAGPESAQGKNYHNSTHPIDMADISGFHTLINNGSHG